MSIDTPKNRRKRSIATLEFGLLVVIIIPQSAVFLTDQRRSSILPLHKILFLIKLWPVTIIPGLVARNLLTSSCIEGKGAGTEIGE